MAWAHSPWGYTPWEGGEVPDSTPPGWTTTPDGDAFVWGVRSGGGAWGMRSWAGAMAVPVYPGGGITAAPDADAGVVRVRVWWPDAPVLQVVRLTEDGARTPVRGAYGLTVAGSTRRNLGTNPSLESATTGYTAIDGNTTLAGVTTAPYVTHGTKALRMVSATTTTGTSIPGGLTGSGQWTIAADIGLTALATSVTCTVAWLTSTGSSAGSSVLTLTADQIAAAVNQPYRAVWGFSAPTNAASGTASLTIAGLTAGQYAYLDAVVVEMGITSGTYYDGSVTGGTWSGTANLSTSLLAPIQEIVDGECPLDIPVVYEVFNPLITGGSMTSTPLTLDSGRRVWLTHPAAPGEPFEALITTTPDVTYALDQAVLPILDSPYPVVVSSGVRRAGAAEVELIVETFADRDRYVTSVFGDGTPVLKRTPASMGYGQGEWIVLGTLQEKASNGSPFDPLRTLTAPYQVVEAPEVVT